MVGENSRVVGDNTQIVRRRRRIYRQGRSRLVIDGESLAKLGQDVDIRRITILEIVPTPVSLFRGPLVIEENFIQSPANLHQLSRFINLQRLIIHPKQLKKIVKSLHRYPEARPILHQIGDLTLDGRGNRAPAVEVATIAKVFPNIQLLTINNTILEVHDLNFSMPYLHRLTIIGPFKDDDFYVFQVMEGLFFQTQPSFSIIYKDMPKGPTFNYIDAIAYQLENFQSPILSEDQFRRLQERYEFIEVPGAEIIIVHDGRFYQLDEIGEAVSTLFGVATDRVYIMTPADYFAL